MAEDLPRSTRALLDLLLQSPRRPGRTLDVASHGAVVALNTGGMYLHVDLTACEAARAAGVVHVTHTDALPVGPFDTICFDAREFDPGLAAEIVADASAALTSGGRLLTTARRTTVEEAFAEVVAVGDAFVASSPRPVHPRPEWPTLAVQWGEHAFRIGSGPGVFSPRDLDEGTRFMLSLISARHGDRFLDLGCGTGAVSLIASEVWGCQVTAVDVNARALRLTAHNAPGAQVLPSDGFRHLGAQEFDIIASNPPYHTDYAVGKAFIEGAARHLVTGGTLYLVVKRADWYVQKVRAVFGGCRVAQEGGYTVIVAEKRDRPVQPQPPAGYATTRKHARRIQISKKRP